MISLLLILLLSVSVGLAWSDLGQRRLPNLLTVTVLLLSLGLATTGQQLGQGLISALVVFGLSAPLVFCRVIGGGDSKLATAYAAALLPAQLPAAALVTLISGGVLALFYLVKYRWLKRVAKDPGLPYGIAIGCGFYWQIWVAHS